MDTTDWLLVTVRCSPDAADAVREALLDLSGRRGTVEQEAGDRVIVGAYIPADAAWSATVGRLSQRLGEIREALPKASLQGPAATIVPSEDWSEAWKREYRTLRVGRVVVKPTWAEPPDLEPDWVVVELDPEMAFGTGGHSSTRLALEALQQFVQPGHALADVGTGTGILAIAAALLGAMRVHAVDSDPIAVRAAVANCRLNGVRDAVAVTCGEYLAGVPTGLDGVVANISPHADRELARAAAAHLRPGGYLILSGFTEEAEDEVAQALQDAGFSLTRRFAEAEWVCLAALGPTRARAPV